MEMHGSTPISVTSLPQNPTPNALYVLTQVDGEYNPGLYSYVSGFWLCSVSLFVATRLPDMAPYESLCLITELYELEESSVLPGLYRRGETSWEVVRNFATSAFFPVHCTPGDLHVIGGASSFAPGLYVCVSPDTWLPAISLSASSGLVWLPAQGLSLSADAKNCDTYFFYPGKPPANTVVFAKQFLRPATIDFTKSNVKAVVAASASRNYNVRKNGTTVAVIAFIANSTGAAIQLVGDGTAVFAAGDVLDIVSPAISETVLTGIFGSLYATYNF